MMIKLDRLNINISSHGVHPKLLLQRLNLDTRTTENATTIHKQVIYYHHNLQNNLCVIVEDWLPSYDPPSQKATLIKIDFNKALFT